MILQYLKTLHTIWVKYFNLTNSILIVVDDVTVTKLQ